MENYIGRLVLLVHDYDDAARFYERNFGFVKIVDYTNEEGLRFLQIGSTTNGGCGLWIIKAAEGQQAQVGNQTGPQPLMVIYTPSLEACHRTLNDNNVSIKVPPITMEDHSFLHCYDLYGNEIIVVEMKT